MGDIANIHREVLFEHPYTPSEFSITPREWNESIAPRVAGYLQDDINLEAISLANNVDIGLLEESAGILLAAFQDQTPKISEYNNTQKAVIHVTPRLMFLYQMISLDTFSNDLHIG